MAKISHTKLKQPSFGEKKAKINLHQNFPIYGSDTRRFWLSCLCPFDHLLPGATKLFGFPIFWLWAFPKIFVFVSLCYFNFSFVSLLFVSSRFRFGNFLLSCLLSRNCYFLKIIVVCCFIYTYRHISFTENTLVKKK